MKMLESERMAPYTTFGIGGQASRLYVPEGIEEMRRCVEAAAAGVEAVMPIGCGSNLLLGEGELPYSFVRPGEGLNYYEFEAGRLVAGAATPVSVIASETARRGLAGMEWAGGVPGTVGGAVAMNAGAFDSEIADNLERVKLVTYAGELLELEAGELDFSYRGSPFPDKGLVVETRFGLREKAPEQLEENLEKYRRKRKSTQPLSQRSAGSVFKNPADDSAGRLIEAAGLKGTREGEAAVSRKHANFIINCGGATYSDVLHLVGLMHERVADEFGVDLEPEINVLPGTGGKDTELRNLENKFAFDKIGDRSE